MDGSIHLRAAERKTLLHVLRTATTHEQRVRAHLLLLLALQVPWSTITAVLFTSTSTINRWRRRFLDGCVNCRRTGSPFFRMRSTSTPTRRSVRCGCVRVSRPRW